MAGRTQAEQRGGEQLQEDHGGAEWPQKRVQTSLSERTVWTGRSFRKPAHPVWVSDAAATDAAVNDQRSGRARGAEVHLLAAAFTGGGGAKLTVVRGFCSLQVPKSQVCVQSGSDG